MIY
ncbi:hypothetical protein D030_3596A, partial [Vibrio parahaemolyticus AQ3810]|jgi:hypothetical protein